MAISFTCDAVLGIGAVGGGGPWHVSSRVPGICAGGVFSSICNVVCPGSVCF